MTELRLTNPGPVRDVKTRYGAHFVSGLGEERPHVDVTYVDADGVLRGARLTEGLSHDEQVLVRLQTLRTRAARITAEESDA